MVHWIRVLCLLCVATLPLGCMSAGTHRAKVGRSEAQEDLTVGKVQREIHKGMNSAQVAETLGSPNIVTTDELGREVWVYDKIATEQAYSRSGAYGTGR